MEKVYFVSKKNLISVFRLDKRLNLSLNSCGKRICYTTVKPKLAVISHKHTCIFKHTPALYNRSLHLNSIAALAMLYMSYLGC